MYIFLHILYWLLEVLNSLEELLHDRLLTAYSVKATPSQ